MRCGFDSRSRYQPSFPNLTGTMSTTRLHVGRVKVAEMSMSNYAFVTPRTFRGTQDILPQEMIARNIVVDKIRVVYERYGFLPLDTPALEYLTTLMGTGGEETNKQ